MSEPKIEDAYLTGTSAKVSRRYGEAARIYGIKIVTPPDGPGGKHYEPRPCYEIVFADNYRMHVPVSDDGVYRIIGRTEADEINRKHAEMMRFYTEVAGASSP